jgi:hypothetical protein
MTLKVQIGGLRNVFDRVKSILDLDSNGLASRDPDWLLSNRRRAW